MCCRPAQRLPSGQHSILSRTSCSALPWLQRWRGWGCKLWEYTHTHSAHTQRTHAHTHTHTHTHTQCCSLMALAAIWRWHSPHAAHWARVMQHVTTTVTSQTCFCFVFSSSPFTLKTSVPPLAPNEYQPLLLFRGSFWQTYSLSTCSSATTGCLNRSSIPPRPAPSTLCRHAIDHVVLPPPPPPPRTCQQHVSRPLPRWETVPLPLGDLLYYYTTWQWAFVSV